MNTALLLIGAIVGVSICFSIILIREYLRVTRKRRELIAALGGSGRAVPLLKHTLITTYLVSTLLWAIGIFLFSFWIL